MSSADKNLSEFSSQLPDGSALNIGIVCAEWNEKITSALYNGAVSILQKSGVSPHHIITRYVPGTFELPLASQQFLGMNP